MIGSQLIQPWVAWEAIASPSPLAQLHLRNHTLRAHALHSSRADTLRCGSDVAGSSCRFTAQHVTVISITGDNCAIVAVFVGLYFPQNASGDPQALLAPPAVHSRIRFQKCAPQSGILILATVPTAKSRYIQVIFLVQLWCVTNSEVFSCFSHQE